ncbi:unnamed protein product [Ectocarpus sp. 8 AP-2014]
MPGVQRVPTLTQGVAVKLPFSETLRRPGWLASNEPPICAFLSTESHIHACEQQNIDGLWGVWYTQDISCVNGKRLTFCP